MRATLAGMAMRSAPALIHTFLLQSLYHHPTVNAFSFLPLEGKHHDGGNCVLFTVVLLVPGTGSGM